MMWTSCNSHLNTAKHNPKPQATHKIGVRSINMILFLLLSKKTRYTITTTISVFNYPKPVNNWKLLKFKELKTSLSAKGCPNPKPQNNILPSFSACSSFFSFKSLFPFDNWRSQRPPLKPKAAQNPKTIFFPFFPASSSLFPYLSLFPSNHLNLL